MTQNLTRQMSLVLVGVLISDSDTECETRVFVVGIVMGNFRSFEVHRSACWSRQQWTCMLAQIICGIYASTDSLAPQEPSTSPATSSSLPVPVPVPVFPPCPTASADPTPPPNPPYLSLNPSEIAGPAPPKKPSVACHQRTQNSQAPARPRSESVPASAAC